MCTCAEEGQPSPCEGFKQRQREAIFLEGFTMQKKILRGNLLKQLDFGFYFHQYLQQKVDALKFIIKLVPCSLSDFSCSKLVSVMLTASFRFSLKLFYMCQCGFYIYSIAALLTWETRRKDFSIMMSHHIITTILIGYSYITRQSFTSVQVMMIVACIT